MKTAPIPAPLPGYLVVLTCPRCGAALEHIYDVVDNEHQADALARCAAPECQRLWTITVAIGAYTQTNQKGRRIYA